MPVDNLEMALLYTFPLPSPAAVVFCESHPLREADLPAQCASPEAQAWLPGADGYPGRTRDPQAPARARSQATVRIVRSVQRRHRLSRSRDFDAVYRRGRSVSTRYLVLYWFPREESEGGARLGVAVPRSTGGSVARNRIKRQVREAWRAQAPEAASDYVLVVRPGLSEAVEARGFEWLTERVQEVLGKAAA
jgi:ribonuclease P protein component